MKITFLGTGTSQGIPVIACDCDVCCSDDPKDKRLRSSVLVQIESKNIVIDTGPDFRQQMLREQVNQLDAVLFTHAHKDHTAGLDDIRAYNQAQQKAIDVYAKVEVQENLKKEFAYIFNDYKYPGIPEIDLHTIDKESNLVIDNTPITPIEVMHYKLPILGYRINDVTYITDAKTISDTEKEKIKGSRILIINALRIKEHISHMNLTQALELVKELKPEVAYFTHISDGLGKHEVISKQLPNNIHLAYDGLTLFA